MSPTSYRTAPPRVTQTFQALIVGLGRFELPTSRLSGVRSNQLSYRPVPLFCRPLLAAKKSHTSVRASRLSADAPEGRVASVASNLSLRSTYLDLPLLQRSEKLKAISQN